MNRVTTAAWVRAQIGAGAAAQRSERDRYRRSAVKPALRALLALGLLCAALLVARAAAAADRYVCDCGSGADPSCVAGDDLADGATPQRAWRSYERARLAFASLLPGESIRFCRGGVFALGAATRWVNPGCRADARCTVEAYAPPAAPGSLPRPRLQQVDGAAFSFDDGGSAEVERGYRLRELDLRCSACGRSQAGLFFYNDVDDVDVERVRLQGFGIGVYVAGAQPCSVGASDCDGMSSRIRLSDLEVRDSRYHGFLGAGDDLTIADSVFENNGSEPVLEHNIYLGGNASRIRVLRNSLYRSAALTSNRCLGSSLVAHGNLSDLLIEGNVIREDVGAASANCWGIDINPGYVSQEGFIAAVVRGNTILNVGSAAIALGACVDCVVENNVIVHQQPHAVIGIRAPAAQFGTGDATLSALVVRNNSLHVATPNSVGIALGGEGSGHVVVGNAIESIAGSGFWACLSLDLPIDRYAAVDHNVCAHVAGTGREWEAGSGALAAWNLASGFDAHSVASAPGFAAPAAPAFDLSAGDAAAAMIGRGDPLLGAPLDFFGAPRGPAPDAGAYQWSGGLFRDGFERP